MQTHSLQTVDENSSIKSKKLNIYTYAIANKNTTTNIASIDYNTVYLVTHSSNMNFFLAVVYGNGMHTASSITLAKSNDLLQLSVASCSYVLQCANNTNYNLYIFLLKISENK